MTQRTDYIVVGSGIAGVRAAIEIAGNARVVVLTKSKADESNTEYAQGGIAVALNDEDEIGLHHQDTINAGDGLCDEAAVRELVAEGLGRIQELIVWGAEFDRHGTKLAFTREAAHSRRRILHAHGDSTGQEINRTLIRKVRTMANASLMPHCLALELLIGDRGCEGVRFLEQRTGRVEDLRGRAVILCTGGMGMMFQDTTNPDVATGDGCALSLRAGAGLVDMEFVQFHPTALKLAGAPRFLLSEALRGEGARLTTASGDRFMERYHSLADLAPRDVVARSIVIETRRRGEDCVYLDMTHLDGDFVRARFPRIVQTCGRFGLDITSRPVPVFPAAHYMMGGVYTDLLGQTTIPGLLAAGEVACTGVHGANRLASNSLLEGLVFGSRAGRTALEQSEGATPQLSAVCHHLAWGGQGGQPDEAPDKEAIRACMTRHVGIVRDEQGLLEAESLFFSRSFTHRPGQEAAEYNNMLANARVISAAARLRKESRGAQYRSDYPERDDLHWRKRFFASRSGSSRRLQFQRLT